MVERVVAALALIVLAPALAVIAAVVSTQLGRPILFRERRVGQHERPFSICKFRTMSDARDPSNGLLLPDAERLGRLGSWLRATSLDELPELWNIARGEMAFVGPRPLPERYLPRFRPEERRRHDVRPGLTGWAQVTGRNALGWDERLARDTWYIDHRTLRLDLQILWRTARVVVTRVGIAAVGHVAMIELPPDRLGAQ